jgi:hypothetical protein
MKKPVVKLNPVANRYAAPGEWIIEVCFPSGRGCLISFGEFENEQARIEVYRADAGIDVQSTTDDRK